MSKKEFILPDLGDFNNVDVVEIYVETGTTVKENDPVLGLETDKAVMDIPAPFTGKLLELKVKTGDTVNTGDLVAILDTAEAENKAPASAPAVEAPKPKEATAPTHTAAPVPTGKPEKIKFHLPEIGDFKDIPVVELFIAIGDTVEAEQPLMSLETDKAVMDVPAPTKAKVIELKIAEGDKVNTGDFIAVFEVEATAPLKAKTPEPTTPAKELPPHKPKADTAPVLEAKQINNQKPGAKFHASPAVRQFARTLGADLSAISGTGPKGRITRDNVTNYIKTTLEKVQTGKIGSQASAGDSIPPIPKVDFSKFGEIEVEPLPRIKKISGTHLHRCWLNVPHVTHFDEADITELEKFRKSLKAQMEKEELKISPLTFILKATAAALKQFPSFNASLDGDNLVLKKYIHIGVAVDTPNGLVVPVIRDVDHKSVKDLAAELTAISQRARESKITPDEMQGGCFTISSLGGIGGTNFTPIVNAPEVAIMGISKSKMQPQWNGSEFVPRLMLPFSISYDHRVIDGAEAARFAKFVSQMLTDIRQMIL